MICIYHNRDLDGFTSAAIVKRKYPEAKLVGYDYGQPLQMEITGEPVIMVDVSVPMKTMLKIAQFANFDFTWIDHHASAIKEYNEFIGNGETFCKAVLQDGISACEITWNYLFPDEKMPESVKLLGEYDTWRNQNIVRWDMQILPFQYGMREICNSPETFPVNLFDSDLDTTEIIKKGQTILQYQAKSNESNCKRNAFEIEFEGLSAICLNGGPFNSTTFDSVYNPDKHDIMMPFQFNGKFWTVSLYTTKDEIDCSVIAKSKGGGGHKKAAGFQAENISFILDKVKKGND